MILKYLNPILLLFLVPLIILFSWFRDGGIHGQGEGSLPFYDVSVSSKFYTSTWREAVSGGYYNPVEISQVVIFKALSFLSFINIPNFLIQALLDYFLMVIGTLSVYFLVKKTVGVELKSNLIPLVAALFYLLNPFSLSQVWGRGLYMQYFPFAHHPLFLLLFVLAIKNKRILPIFFALIFSFTFASAFQHVAYVVSLWLLIFLYCIFYIYYHRTRKDILTVIIFFSIAFIGWLLTQAWWMVLYFRLTVESYYVPSGYVDEAKQNLGTLLGVSKDYPLVSIIRLIHEGYFFRDAKYGDIYKSIPFQLISWLIPAILIFSIKYLKETKYLKFFGIIFLVGLFVSLGANFPTGLIFIWLFNHIPPFQIFRNPFEKFGLTFILGYSVLFSLGLYYLVGKVGKLWGTMASKLILAIPTVLVLAVYSWPLWSGRVISGIDNKVGIIVPSYYQDFKEWIHSQELEGYRLMMLPIASGEGVVYKWGDRLYNGIPPSDYLLDYPAISSTPQFAYLYEYLHSLRKYIHEMNVVPAISLLGSKYLVDRQDMVMISQGEKQHKNYLLDTIYPPLGIDKTKRKMCNDISKRQVVDNSIWLVCEVPLDQKDWKDIKYLHVRLKTDVAAFLEIAIRDSLQHRPRWDGRADSQYSTNTDQIEVITVALGAPSEYTDKMDHSDVRLVEIIAHPKNKGEAVKSLLLEGIWLDEGEPQKVNEYKHVLQFGMLDIYESINFNSPPHFGILESAEKVKSFKELFEKARDKRSQVNKLGFLLKEQNKSRDINKIASSSAVNVLDATKVTNAKYFMEIEGTGPFNLVLSELFDPHWKVIPDVEKEDLNGSLLNNIKLLKMSSIGESDHFVINGYANLWTINDGAKKYAVVLLPQILRDIGFRLTIFVILGLSILTGGLLLKSYFKKRTQHS